MVQPKSDDEDDALVGPPPEISPEAFAESFGESLQRTIDLDTWSDGADLSALYGQTQAEILESVKREEGWRRIIRETIFPEIANTAGGPPGAGVYEADLANI